MSAAPPPKPSPGDGTTPAVTATPIAIPAPPQAAATSHQVSDGSPSASASPPTTSASPSPLGLDAPYVIAEPVEAGIPIVQMRLATYPGLGSVQIVENSTHTIAICHWETERAFQRYGPGLAAIFRPSQSAANPVFAGRQGELLTPNPGLWTRIKTHWLFIGVLLSGVAGWLGHVEKIRETWLEFFCDEPTIHGSATALKVSEGSTFTATFDLQNESPFSPLRAELTTISVRDENDADANARVQLDPFQIVSFPRIPAAEKKSVTITGKADRPGQYSLSVGGDYRPLRPWWRQSVPVKGQMTLNVWKISSIEKTEIEPQTGGAACYVRFRLSVGKTLPQGLTISAELAREPNLRIQAITVNRAPVIAILRPPQNTTPGNEYAVLETNVKDLLAFEETTGLVILETIDGHPKTANEWNRITKQLNLVSFPSVK